jgi:hypothetical protein
MTTNSEKILATIDHLYWFKDTMDDENQKDFIKTIKSLVKLITDTSEQDPT